MVYAKMDKWTVERLLKAHTRVLDTVEEEELETLKRKKCVSLLRKVSDTGNYELLGEKKRYSVKRNKEVVGSIGLEDVRDVNIKMVDC